MAADFIRNLPARSEDEGGKMSGFVKAQRERFDHPLFAREKFCRGYAWDWMIASAAWGDTRIDVKGQIVTLERGQLCYSVRFMAERFGWSKSAVDRFLTRLKSGTMIETATGTGQLVITICNYDKYQGYDLAAGTVSGTRAGTEAGQERDRSGTNKKNEKKDKNTSSAPAVQFDDFWQAYPHRGGAKKGRAGAEKSYARALASGVTEQDLIDAAVRYGHDRMVRDGYAKDPATWLNQKGWADEIEPAPLRAVTKKPEYGDMRELPNGNLETYHPYSGWVRTHV
jgi:hypothetical protein